MGTIFIKALSLILVILAGFVIKKLGWVCSDDFPKFSKIVLRITLPCALITSFNEFTITYSLLFLTAIGIGANLLMQLTGYLINRRKGKKEQAFGILNIGSYNIGVFATPYISGFIGAESVIYSSLFDIGNSVGAAGIGYGWAMSVSKENEKTNILNFFKTMFRSPVFVTYLVLLVMSLLDLHFPDEVLILTSMVGSANVFLAMLMIGIGLELRLDSKKYKKAFGYLGLRYMFALIFTILTQLFLPLSQVVKTVLCMLYFSPIAAMIAGFTGDAEGDVETSAFMTSVSYIVGIIAMPVLLYLMG